MHHCDDLHHLCCALDAIDALLALLDEEPATTLVALVDHLPQGGRVVVPIDGGDPGPGGAGALDGLLRHALADAPGARIVLGSIRDDGGDTVAEADLAMWRTLVQHHEGSSVTLLDWFVITDAAVLSLAELTGRTPPWRC